MLGDLRFVPGLYFTSREINELIKLIGRYNAQEKIFFISLAENGEVSKLKGLPRAGRVTDFEGDPIAST